MMSCNEAHFISFPVFSATGMMFSRIVSNKMEPIKVKLLKLLLLNIIMTIIICKVEKS